MTTDLTAVLDLAKRHGWHVFPLDSPQLPQCAGIGRGHYPATCTDRGKHPCVPWAKQATTDPQQIAAWFTGNPRNVGIACGPSGLLVIDEDERGELEKYAAGVGATVPDTFTVATGRGTHFYFRADGHDFGNAEHALKAYGVNVRGRGGFVVGPGSLHANGARYRVTSDVPPAPIPPWLVAALTPPQEAPSGHGEDPFAPRGPDALPEVIRVHKRDDTLMRYACSLRARNTPIAEAEVLMRWAWERCEQPPGEPYTWEEAVTTLHGCYRQYPAGQALTDTPSVDLNTGTRDPILGHVLRRSELGNLPSLRPLVKGLLDYPSAVVLVGSYGIGKTFLGIALACCVATGRPWMGRPVERRRVLLVVGEGGSGLNKRIAAWEQGYNQGQPVNDADLIVMLQPRSLTDRNVWQRIGERCMAEDVGFVILDTLSSLAPDADETKDSALVVSQMHRLAADTGGVVLLVHHPGWSDNGRTRGGYQFEGNTDDVLLLTGTPEEPLMQLRRKKVKDDENGQVFWMRRKPYTLAGEHLGQTSVVLESLDPSQVGAPMVERIKSVLDGYGERGATGPQIKVELGGDAIPGSTFYKALGKAEQDGVVVQRGNGNQRRYYLARRE
ncbi:bifunctional DNA primase/polymerase [Nocardioides sp.]|uniref:bifunctional DNA primase/polymerase n=1 Tax=Nocardioides sp. TaxID=35761 RepID=UPI0027346CBC|nr:bifunctional DNA primase/polymerase [Nocardioides sp.]MDP3890335.1 bifunctional DNA primase/polymerase [Nocardioides sp.]